MREFWSDEKVKREFWSQEKINQVKADKKERDKIIAELEKLKEKGKLLVRPTRQQHVATEDAIRNYCNGIGDVNPLYRSQDYARNSVYGGLIAPPHFLEAIAFFIRGGRGEPYPSYVTGGFHSGDRVEWFKVIREDDKFTVHYIPGEVKDITREGTALQFLSSGKTIYTNQRGEVVANVTSYVLIIISPANDKDGLDPKFMEKVKKIPKLPHYSEQEVEEWYKLMEQEEIRGAIPRYWEDVNVGDKLPPTHHFWTLMSSAAFFAGCGWLLNDRFLSTVPAGGSMQYINTANTIHTDPETGLPDCGPMVHFTDVGARQSRGVDRAICAGVQMDCWLGQVVTNWMGDAGFLKSMDVQFRKPLFRGAKALCKGEVVKKYIEGDEHLVDLHLTLEDQDGEFPIPNCSATVALPSLHSLWRPR